MFIRKAIIFREIAGYYSQSNKHKLSSSVFQAAHSGTQSALESDSLSGSISEFASSCHNHRLYSSHLFPKAGNQSMDYKIDILDDETWKVSTGFADVWKNATAPSQSPAQVINNESRNSNDPDFDEIDDLRICGNLFYKIDRDSKEYEEYNFDFHRRKSSKNKPKQTLNSNSGNENVSKRKDEMNASKLKGNSRIKSFPAGEELSKFNKKDFIEKKQRTPTFNQLTAAYHEPFCLDIYISKASVRACIVHRATSNVVAVAHSISKDMKFDLGSTKNAAACAAVGKVLAQRALADDIHNVVYTPRKGEKIEGKLQNVVQSVINNGVMVKIKLKKKQY